MRESTYNYPLLNRAVVGITHLMYDRRAIDTNNPVPLLNNLTSLTYLTSTSPRIREILTVDGGLERLIDILRESCDSPPPRQTDLWGLNGPTTAKVISPDKQRSLRHSLAFQCVVNIGVRGSEEVRTRVVQSGALDLVAQILESWLQKYKIAIHPHSLGSQALVDAVANGDPMPDHSKVSRSRPRAQTIVPDRPTVPAPPQTRPTEVARIVDPPRPLGTTQVRAAPEQSDNDVEMSGYEADDAAERASVGGDASMDVDIIPDPPATVNPNDLATPRAGGGRLPEHGTGALNIPTRPVLREEDGMSSSGANSMTGSEDGRGASDVDNESRNAAQLPHRPPPLNLAARMPALADGGLSNQSSPMGTPPRVVGMDTDAALRDTIRRDTLRPIVLASPPPRRREREPTDSGASENGDNVDVNLETATATIDAGIAAALREGQAAMTVDEPEIPPNIEIVQGNDGMAPDQPDTEAIAEEQARLDMEAGAPPGMRDATTPPGPGTLPGPVPTPAQMGAAATRPGRAGAAPAQVIIANGAPRGFHDLGAYLGISSILHPNGDRFSDDSVLLSLQLLAYLSKYPHVRTTFHHPHVPMHMTFQFASPDRLPRRPPKSATNNIFSLVERFTFRPSVADPYMFKVPPEIQYWAGVIMRNACRKDDARAGIRQCAHMSCGKWEKSAREFAKCRRCRKAKYCSKTCQSAAWSEGHRFWCNNRSDGEALPESSTAATGAAQPAANTQHNRPIDFWEIALRLCIRTDQAERAGLALIIADARPPPGFEPRLILAWMTGQLVPALMNREPDEGETTQSIQDDFLEVVRSQPNVIQALYIQSMTNPNALHEGIEMTLMQARLQRQHRQDANPDADAAPMALDNPEAIQEADTVALTADAPAAQLLPPGPQVAQNAPAGGFRGLFGGNVPDTPPQNAAQQAGGRNFRLTEIWRQMANRQPNNASPDNNAGGPQGQ